MSDQHRPLLTRHGTHCICGVFCGSGRDVESWRRHSRDRVLLDGTVVGMNPSPVTEEWWTVLEGFRRIGQAYVNAGRKLAQALAPLNRDSFTKLDGDTGARQARIDTIAFLNRPVVTPPSAPNIFGRNQT